MEYTKLNTDQQRQMLEQRITQYEAEYFQHSVNKDLLVASGDTSERTQAAIKVEEDAMATLDDAHACCVQMLAESDPGT